MTWDEQVQAAVDCYNAGARILHIHVRDPKTGKQIGLHTGECDVSGDNYSGYAVELARNIARLSESGNILVSRTVKDLVAGSGLTFVEFGVRSFDGVDSEWRLFEVVN